MHSDITRGPYYLGPSSELLYEMAKTPNHRDYVMIRTLLVERSNTLSVSLTKICSKLNIKACKGENGGKALAFD